VVGIGIVFWCLLMFGNGASRAVVHQGSYLLPILGMVAGIAGLRAVFPRAGTWITAVWATFMLVLYVPELTPPEASSYSFRSIVICAVCLVAYCLVAFGWERREKGRDEVEARPAVAIDSPA